MGPDIYKDQRTAGTQTGPTDSPAQHIGLKHEPNIYKDRGTQTGPADSPAHTKHIVLKHGPNIYKDTETLNVGFS
jgi:hypothetical protein